MDSSLAKLMSALLCIKMKKKQASGNRGLEAKWKYKIIIE